MKKLTFSFIIPAHNEEDIIEDCINSILKQPEKNYEIVVVNDGSSDNTKKIVEGFMKKNKSIQLVNHEKGTSAAYARNKGAEKAKGEYLIFLDADQTLEEEFMKKLLKLINVNRFEIGAIRILSTKPESFIQKAWHAYREYNRCATPVVKKKLFDKIRYNEKLFYVEDDVIFEDARQLGNKITETGVWVYHIDPKTLKDNWRQRKWQGRGLVMKIFVLKKYWAIRYFAPCLVLPLMFFSPYFLLAYLAIFWIFLTIKSKEPINSFCWVIVDFIGRFISLFWFFVFLIVAVIKGKII